MKRAIVIFLILQVLFTSVFVFAQDSLSNSTSVDSQVVAVDDSLGYLDDNTLNYIETPITKEESDRNEKLKAEKEKLVKEFLLNDKKQVCGVKKVNPLTGQSYTLYATYVPIYEQINCYYCGPATALQTIGNWQNYFPERVLAVPSNTKAMWWWSGCCKDGNYSNTATTNWKHPSSSTHKCYTSYTSQQVTLANIAGTTISGSGMIGVVNAINSYLSPTYYTSSSITSTDQSYLESWTKYDFYNNHSVAYLVSTYYLSRYAGHSTGHFISGYSYEDYDDYSLDNMGLADCNNDSSYGGSYRESFNDVHKALYKHGGTNIAW